MKTIIISNWRPLRHAFILLLCIAALWATPRGARAQQLYVTYGNTVAEYNATTGAVINPSFITSTSGTTIFGLLFSGNILYVANYDTSTLGEYNATTGAVINANFITGLTGPLGLALSGNILYVANSGGTVGEYNATTGAVINAAFIRTPSTAYGLAISGNTLFVAQFNAATVGEYNATTGATINASFITGLSQPTGLALSGNILYVANAASNTVGEYDATTGAAINASLITGLTDPFGIAISGNTLFVAGGTVGEYNATTGAAINGSLITTVPAPYGLAVVVTLPIANAGLNQTVQAGTLVTLNGSASSDPSGQLPLTYAWSFVSQPAGSTATLSNPAIVNPTFTPDALGNYVIQLVVTDAAGLSSVPATVTISTTDAPPVANAGPNQTITAVGTLVQLNGSQSYDLAGFPITYQWSFVSKPAGSSASLTGPTTATPSFVADVAGDYSIQLIVTDSLGTASTPAVVNVSFNDVAPIANAGSSQSAVVGETVTLNGSKSSDTDGEPLTYQWSVVSAPSGSTAAISNPTAEIASFVPDLPGTYVVQLIVNDGFLNSLPATTEIVAVSQQTQLTQQIRNLQGVIANMPPSAFRNVIFRDAMLIELNVVLLTVTAHDYSAALQLLQNVILPEINGCATTGAPERSNWIVNCPDQSMVYTPLLNIIAEVKALSGG
jgi:PQQ-like domain/PKD domain